MIEQHSDDDHAVLIRIRLRSLTVLSELMRHATVVNNIRRTELDSVRNGKATLMDLYSSAIRINGMQVEETDLETQFKKMSSSNKNTYFPLKDICDLTGISVRDYQQNLDPHYARRDAFCQIKMLMEKARDSNFGVVAHPLLIEELVTTLNTRSIGTFPFSFVTSSGEPRSPSTDAADDKTLPPKRGIYIQCNDTKKISVYSHLYPLDWVDGKVAAHLRYDITVADDGSSIRYENVRTLFIFPGGPSKDIEEGLSDMLDEFGFPADKSTSLSRRRFADALGEAPSTYPADTFFLSVNIPDESIRSCSMYSAPVQHTSSTHGLSSDADDLADGVDYVGRSTGIRRFFKRLSNSIVSVLKFIAYPFQKAFSVIASGVSKIFGASKSMSCMSAPNSYDSEYEDISTGHRYPDDSSISSAGSPTRSSTQEQEVVMSSNNRSADNNANSDEPSSHTDSVGITASTSSTQHK